MRYAFVAEVEQFKGSTEVVGRLESPKTHTRFGAEVVIVGWALGKVHPVTAVELVREGIVLARIQLDQERLDVAAAFPSQPWAAMSGFRAQIQMDGTEGAEMLVQAVTEVEGSVQLAKIHFGRTPLQEAEALLSPPLVIRRSAPLGRDPLLWPTPPPELMEYGEDAATHLRYGSANYETMRANCASAGVHLDDARTILEFGCSNGRVTRWLAGRAEREVWGCDIQADKIFWALENLTPPLRFLVNEPTAHLPFKDESFDLVCAFSVFTHLKENHVGWLCELVRLVAPGGALYITVHDETAFAQPDAAGVIARRFGGLEHVGDLQGVRYAAVNDYKAGALAQVYLSQEYIEQLLPSEFGIKRVFPRAMFTQSAYLIARHADLNEGKGGVVGKGRPNNGRRTRRSVPDASHSS